MSKLFKFWRYRLELKLNKLSDKDRIEFLANELVKELNFDVDPDCQLIDIWIHNKKELKVSRIAENNQSFIDIYCKYTGK